MESAIGYSDTWQPGFISRDKKRMYPVTALYYNFNKTTSSKHDLLGHKDIALIGHELGHCLHGLLSRTRYATFYGNWKSKDFVEVPSIMLEQWCWSYGALKRLSGHYESGEPLPDDMIQAILDGKHIENIYDNYQVGIAAWDQAIHTPASQKDAEEMNLPKLYNDIMCGTVGVKGLDRQVFDCGTMLHD
jgi:Zn-dependent oligopeptidase